MGYLQDANLNCSGIQHDLVDTARQLIQIVGDIKYGELVDAFTEKDIPEFQ